MGTKWGVTQTWGASEMPIKMLLLHTLTLVIYRLWVTEIPDPFNFILEKPILPPHYTYLNSSYLK